VQNASLKLSNNSEPVKDAPYQDAIHVRDTVLEQSKTLPGDLIQPMGEKGSRCWNSYMTRKKLYFDPRMENFWSVIRRHQTNDYALQGIALLVITLTESLHPFLLQDYKKQKRDVERVIKSLRSSAQSLKSVPYFDIPVFQAIDTGWLRNRLRHVLEDCSLRNNDTGQLDELFDHASDYFAETLPESAQRDQMNRRLESQPETLSQFLRKVSDWLSIYAERLAPTPFNPKPNEEGSDVRLFCRMLDYRLRVEHNVSTPKQVATCANVVFGADVDATDVKRWRIQQG